MTARAKPVGVLAPKPGWVRYRVEIERVQLTEVTLNVPAGTDLDAVHRTAKRYARDYGPAAWETLDETIESCELVVSSRLFDEPT